MSLGHLSQLINKKIFSDDFDKVSFAGLQKKTSRVGASSTIDQPINEDTESEKDDYLSDSSSSSQFSLQRRYLSLDLSKLMDKLEPLDDSSAAAKYAGNVTDTIEEEIQDDDDEAETHSRLSQHSSNSSRRNNRRFYDINSNPAFMSFLRHHRRPRPRSSITQLESEAIMEELEEYDYTMPIDRIDKNMHRFIVPSRLRTRTDSDNNSLSNRAGNSTPKSKYSTKQ